MMKSSWFLAVLLCVMTALPTALSQDRPNILVLISDSMDGRLLDPTDHQWGIADTPLMSYFVEEGTNFIGMYSNNPMCVPARSSLITGRYTHKQGTYNNNLGFTLFSNGTVDGNCADDYGEEKCQYLGKYLQNNTGTWVDYFASIDYDVYMFGKMDVGGGILQQFTEDRGSRTNGDGFHKAPQLKVCTRSANIERSIEGNPETSDVLNLTVNDFRSGDVGYATSCAERLRALGNESRESNGTSNPWFVFCSMRLPHPPFFTNATWLSRVDIDAVQVPPNIPFEDLDTMHPYYQYMTIVKNVTYDYSDDVIREIRSAYYALNVQTDAMFEIIWNATLESGFNLSNTIVVVTSDHGELQMDHRQYWKNAMYEGSVRVPLVIAGPGIAKNKTVANYTDLVDLLPTFLDLAGANDTVVPNIRDMDGQSLVRFLDYAYLEDTAGAGSYEEFEDYAFVEYHASLANTGAYMIRKGSYKYVQFGHYLSTYQNYSAILYDLETDPDETMDLIDDPSYAAVVSEMEEVLSNTVNYEYYDCVYKHNDYNTFKEYYWDVYNASTLYHKMGEKYIGFDDSDWQTLVNWFYELAVLEYIGNTTNFTYDSTCECLMYQEFGDCLTAFPMEVNITGDIDPSSIENMVSTTEIPVATIVTTMGTTPEIEPDGDSTDGVVRVGMGMGVVVSVVFAMFCAFG